MFGGIVPGVSRRSKLPSLIHLLLRVIPALLPVSAFLEPLIVFIIVDLPVFGNPATIKRNVLFTPLAAFRSIFSFRAMSHLARKFCPSRLESPSISS